MTLRSSDLQSDGQHSQFLRCFKRNQQIENWKFGLSWACARWPTPTLTWTNNFHYNAGCKVQVVPFLVFSKNGSAMAKWFSIDCKVQKRTCYNAADSHNHHDHHYGQEANFHHDKSTPSWKSVCNYGGNVSVTKAHNWWLWVPFLLNYKHIIFQN